NEFVQATYWDFVRPRFPTRDSAVDARSQTDIHVSGPNRDRVKADIIKAVYLQVRLEFGKVFRRRLDTVDVAIPTHAPPEHEQVIPDIRTDIDHYVPFPAQALHQCGFVDKPLTSQVEQLLCSASRKIAFEMIAK
ncbi:MAG: hypothetical protein WB783_11685, partial [Arenicellales bacterium]